ncbi:MAG: polysaccharide deacetylase family protein, partial [Propionibacteriaceae bacterium]|nr:polysaccharide deacetylase family protein [Propionibacteriaceae bacterium]
IALAIDDGPSIYTAEALDTFKKKDVPVTFFVLGSRITAEKKLLKRMIAEGHVIGNHSWNHPQFWHMTSAQIKSQLTRTTKLIKKFSGTTPTLVRPPYGQSNAGIRKVFKSLGMSQVLWSVDPEDWKVKDTATVVQRVVSATRRGSIILTHDVYDTTVKAYPKIIDKLRKKGYVFVTVPELFGDKMKAGVNYSQRN